MWCLLSAGAATETARALVYVWMCVCTGFVRHWTSLNSHWFCSVCLRNIRDTFLSSSVCCVILFPPPLYTSLLTLMLHIFYMIFLSIPLTFLLLVGSTITNSLDRVNILRVAPLWCVGDLRANGCIWKARGAPLYYSTALSKETFHRDTVYRLRYIIIHYSTNGPLYLVRFSCMFHAHKLDRVSEYKHSQLPIFKCSRQRT